MGSGTFSLPHLLILGLVILVLFGGKGKISDIMGDFAKGIKSFKKGPGGRRHQAGGERAATARSSSGRRSEPDFPVAESELTFSPQRRGAMFEFDAGKLIIIAIAALIFIGPKDLPRVMRQFGQIVGKLRRMGAEFQAQFMEAMNEAGAEDLKAGVQELTESAKVDLGFNPLSAAHTEVMSAVRQIEAPVDTVSEAPAVSSVAAEVAEVARAPVAARAANE